MEDGPHPRAEETMVPLTLRIRMGLLIPLALPLPPGLVRVPEQCSGHREHRLLHASGTGLPRAEIDGSLHRGTPRRAGRATHRPPSPMI